MALRSISTSTLRAELARRERGASKLQARHRMLAAQVAALEREMADLGVDAKRRGRPPGRRGPGRPPGHRGPGRPPNAGRRGRGGNAMTLPVALAKAVRVGATMSPADATKAVRRYYKSASNTFGVMVAIALAKSPAFKRVGRGQYLRKGGTAVPPARRGPKPKMGRPGRKGGRGGRRKARAASRSEQGRAGRRGAEQARRASSSAA